MTGYAPADEIFVASDLTEIGSFRAVVRAFPDVWNKSVLDVGSRSGDLRRVLPDRDATYYGLDIRPPVDVIGNLELGLPFQDRSFNTVVALDVLEHTDDIYQSIQELCRVSDEHVVIALPNVYDIRGRYLFLFGHTLSAKYGLPAEPPSDRHRWLFDFAEAKRFCAYWAAQLGFQIRAQGSLIGPRRALLPGKFIVRSFPNLFSPRYLALLTRAGINSVGVSGSALKNCGTVEDGLLTSK